MIGVYGALPGGWWNPVNVGTDLASSVVTWLSPTVAPLPEVGSSDRDYQTPTQIVQSPDVQVPQRIERPTHPVQSSVPGVTPAQMAADPYQTQVQLPASRSKPWVSWLIGGGIFLAFVGAASGFVAVRRRRRRSR